MDDSATVRYARRGVMWDALSFKTAVDLYALVELVRHTPISMVGVARACWSACVVRALSCTNYRYHELIEIARLCEDRGLAIHGAPLIQTIVSRLLAFAGHHNLLPSHSRQLSADDYQVKETLRAMTTPLGTSFATTYYLTVSNILRAQLCTTILVNCSRATPYEHPKPLAERWMFHAIKDAFGNPFKAYPRGQVWRNDSTVIDIAKTIFDNREFEDFPILADALEDAGCDDPVILNHCRHHPVHQRSCWVLRQILTTRKW